MKIYRLGLMLFFVCMASAGQQCRGQHIPLSQLHIRHITKEQGLRYNTVECFLHDSKGYMWMGGFALQRYDGYRFKTYIDGGGNQRITSLLEDSAGTIWAGTNKGLYKFIRAEDKFVLFQDSVVVGKQKIKLHPVQMVCDALGDIWIASLTSIVVLRQNADKAVDAASLFKGLARSDAQRISLDKNGDLWLGASGEYGILRYNVEEKRVYHQSHNPDNEGIFKLQKKGLNFLNDGKGNIWFNDGFDSRLQYRYNINKNQLFTYRLACNQLQLPGCWPPPDGLLTDKEGNVWVTMAEHFGLARYNAVADNFEYLYAGGKSAAGLLGNISIANPGGYLYIDRSGNFWYGGNEGVNFFSPYSQSFLYNNTLPQAARGVTDAPPLVANLNGMVKMNDGYYYGIYYGNGLWKFDNNFMPLEKIKLGNTSTELLWTVFSSDGETLFFSDQYRHLFSFNIRTGKVEISTASKYLVTHTCSYYVADMNTVWLGHVRNGISRFNPVTAGTETFPFDSSGGSPVASYVAAILPGKANYIWYACQRGGLFLFNTLTGKTERNIDRLSGDKEPMAVYSAAWYRNDTMLLATTTGIVFLNTKTNKGRRIAVPEGLPDNFILGILADTSKKQVWFNTLHSGIGRLNTNDGSVTLFPASTGNTASNGDAFIMATDDNRLIFAAHNGFTVTQTNKLPGEKDPPPVHITEVWVNGILLNTDSLLKTGKSIALNHRQNTIRFRVSGLNYWEKDALYYYVKKGNDDWVRLEKNAELEYTDMPPGNYTFSFRSSINNQVYSPETRLGIQIKPPFIRSRLFYFLLGTVVAGSLYMLYRYRLRHIRKQEEEKSAYRQQLAELEVKALRSQMNPHFIFNSLNAINRYILKSDKASASAYLTKFSKLIRRILDNSRQQKIPLSQEIEALQLYLEMESLRFQQNFTWKIMVDENISPTSLFIPPMTVQPFAENAIWHGLLPKESDCKLYVHFKGDSNFLTCIVEDNGIGRKSAAVMKQESVISKSSLGISSTEKRLKLMTAGETGISNIEINDLYDAAGSAAGTRVTIRLPYLYN